MLYGLQLIRRSFRVLATAAVIIALTAASALAEPVDALRPPATPSPSVNLRAAIDRAGRTTPLEMPSASRTGVAVQPRSRSPWNSVGGKIAAGAIGGLAGFYGGAWLGDKIERQQCDCGDVIAGPIIGAFVGAGIGAAVGVVIAAKQ